MTDTNDNRSNLDKIFLIFTASGLSGGTLFTFLLSFFPYPLVPSIFFGLAVSSWVYRFMGGIDTKNSVVLGGVKIGGTLGAYMATVMFLNTLLMEQINISAKPDNIVALEKESAKAVKLGINIGGKEKKSINEPDRNTLEKLRDACASGRGICEQPKLEVAISEDSSLKKGSAKVCMNQGKLLEYPLLVQSHSRKDKLRAVYIVSTDSCTDESDQPLSIKVSSNDAKALLKPGEKTGKGNASVPPLKNGFVKDLLTQV